MSGEALRGGRILIVHQGGLGDFILAVPAIRALRESLQPVRLEIMGHPWILQLVEGRTYADGIHDVNRAEMALFFQEDAHLPEGMCGYLSGFDTAVIFGTGTTLAQNLRRAGITRTFTLPPFPKGRRHLVDHHLSSVTALGISATPTPPRIFLRGEDHEWAEGFFRQRGLDLWNLHRIIALHPGAGSRKKTWHPHRFAALGRALASDGRALLIIQGPADEDAVGEMLRVLNGTAHLLTHNLSVIKLAALLSRASLFIGNDSGVSHLAAALGVPTVAIFGPTDPLIWAPRGERAWWLQGEASCAPCRLQQRQTCERQRCLDTIEVEDLLKFLARGMEVHREAVLQDSGTLPNEGISHSVKGHEAIPVPRNQQ